MMLLFVVGVDDNLPFFFSNAAFPGLGNNKTQAKRTNKDEVIQITL
jgi:hypothetical protein